MQRWPTQHKCRPGWRPLKISTNHRCWQRPGRGRQPGSIEVHRTRSTIYKNSRRTTVRDPSRAQHKFKSLEDLRQPCANAPGPLPNRLTTTVKLADADPKALHALAQPPKPEAPEQGAPRCSGASTWTPLVGAKVTDAVHATCLLEPRHGLCRSSGDIHYRHQRRLWRRQCGTGVSQDYVEAARLCRLAADQGHAVAQCNLGCMYKHGRGPAGRHRHRGSAVVSARQRTKGTPTPSATSG